MTSISNKETQEKVGLLGGTFDPVHMGHLQLADIAKKQFQLDRVMFIPASVPPHKPHQEISSFHHRTVMLELALAEIGYMGMSRIEGSLPTPSYTIDTLTALERENDKTNYFYIMGLDTFLEVDTWKSYTKLLQRLHFIVVARSGYQFKTFDHFLKGLGYVKDQKGWLNLSYQKRIFFCEKEIITISSSKIRDMLKSEQDVDPYLPESVIEYIHANRLYQV